MEGSGFIQTTLSEVFNFQAAPEEGVVLQRDM